MIYFVPVKGLAKDYPETANVVYLDDTTGDSMTSKYNYALDNFVKDSKDEWFCFRHDDLVIKTDELAVEKQLEKASADNVGIAGVIGTVSLERQCVWWEPFKYTQGAGAIMQLKYDPKTHKIVEPREEYAMPIWPGYHNCLATVDGCIFYFNRKLYEKGVRFDENLKSYHFYDVDISCQCLRAGMKVATLDMICTHESPGFMPKNFNDYREVFYNKWNALIDTWPITQNTRFK